MAAGSKPWWVVWDADANSGKGSVTVVQAATKPAEPKNGNVFGPFKTQAAAEQAAQSPTGILGQIQAAGIGAVVGAGTQPAGEAATGVAGAAGTVGIPGVSNPLGFLGGLVEIGHFFGKLVSDLTDPYMWISLGWLFLGLVLLVIGIILWLKHEDLLPNVVPVPVPVPA